MTDQELVRLAAKAQGVHLDEKLSPWFTYSDADGFQWLSNDGHRVRASYNPLHNPADTMRLQVKLGMSVSTGPCEARATTIQGALDGFFPAECTVQQNPLAAVCRVVVRAAAWEGAKL